MTESTWWVYLLQCRSGRIYTGATVKLDRRVMAHRKGHGALATRIDIPVRLLAAKPFPSRREAMVVESQVKPVPPAMKLTLAKIWSQQHPIDEATQRLLSVD